MKKAEKEKVIILCCSVMGIDSFNPFSTLRSNRLWYYHKMIKSVLMGKYVLCLQR